MGTLLLIVSPLTCSRATPDVVESGVAAPAQSSVDIHVGEEVVVLKDKGVFVAGKVASLTAEVVVYQSGSVQAEAPRSHVSPLRKGEPLSARPGDYAVCRALGRYWQSCRILSFDGAVYACEDEDGESRRLKSEDILIPTATVQQRIQGKLERAARRREFLNAAQGAGKPVRPGDWQPSVGQRVIAPHLSAWEQGTIVRIVSPRVTIRWDDRSGASERELAEIAPEPREGNEVAIGAYVLVRPVPSGSYRWGFGRVTSASPKAIDVVNEDGDQRSVRSQDVLPLGR